MLSPKMTDALNDHLNFEMNSAYLYLSMSAYFRSIDLNGFASWMQVQFEEEMFHAEKFFNFIDDRDGRVKLGVIEQPQAEWDSSEQAFIDSYEHEKKVTARIYKLVDIALQDSDHGTNAFLQWFVAEQVEEESTVKGIYQKLKLAKDNSAALLFLDNELGSRTFSKPA